MSTKGSQEKKEIMTRICYKINKSTAYRSTVMIYLNSNSLFLHL
jgi:hypothetical protein